MSEPLLIRGGTVVTDGASTRADVLVRDQRIAAVGAAHELSASGCRILDASDCLILPGGVDAHTHVLGRVHDDGIAALSGGTTTALAFVDAEPGEAPADAARRTIVEQLDDAPIDVGLHGVVWEPERYRREDVAELAEMGVTSLKLWLAYPELGIMADDAQACAVISDAARERVLVLAHCENGGMIATLGDALHSERHLSLDRLPQWRPAIAETEAVHRFLAMAELFGAEAYVVHVSARRALHEIAEARQRGVVATAESCAHHLAFDDSVYAGADAIRYLVAPPLRSSADVAALWTALADGRIDVLASDHGHDRLADRREAQDDVTRVPVGLPGIELRLPVAFALGVGEGRLSAERLVEVACAAPARAFGLFPRKGTIRPGADADIVIWDPAPRWTVGPDTRHDGLDYSPYDGMEMTGVARNVIAGGEVVVANGAFSGRASPGRFLARPRLPVRRGAGQL